MCGGTLSVYKKERQARKLQNAQSLLYSAHHRLRWLNFYEPPQGALEDIKIMLEEVILKLTRVIDGDSSDRYTVIVEEIT